MRRYPNCTSSLPLINPDDGYENQQLVDAELTARTSTASNLDQAYLWLIACCDTHSICRKSQKEPVASYPTRLLDLGCEDSKEWRLITTVESLCYSTHQPYLALSYRWDAHSKLLLLTSTLDSFRVGKPIMELPCTFRDLVTVARRFRILYLWIDALCIVQDSPKDWEYEALRMRSVYANSACTVAASASSDETEGLFRSRNPESFKPGLIRVPVTHSESQICQIFERDYWNLNISRGPLHKRGWVFQERHLSTSVLYFANDQILWECREGAKCEGFPEGIPYYLSDKNLDYLWQLRERERETGKEADEGNEEFKMPGEIYVLWRDLLKRFTDCSFTKVEEKLPAFAGIAKLFQEVTGDEYIAGLWRSRFFEGLDWHVAEPRHKTSLKYRAPSWPWASIDGPVEPEFSRLDSTYLFDIIDVKVTPRCSDATGAITDGYLKIRACLWKPILINVEPHGSCISFGLHTSTRLEVQIDCLDTALVEGAIMYCFAFSSFLSDGYLEETPSVSFICLEPLTGLDVLKYRRTGWLKVDGKGRLASLGMQSDEHGLMVPDRDRGFSDIIIV